LALFQLWSKTTRNSQKAVATVRQLVTHLQKDHTTRIEMGGRKNSRVTGQSLNRCTARRREISKETLKDITARIQFRCQWGKFLVIFIGCESCQKILKPSADCPFLVIFNPFERDTYAYT